MTKTKLFVANINAIIAAGDSSVSEIARKSGIDRPRISELLNGRQQSCTIDRAEKIADAVGIPLVQLFAGPVYETAK